MLPPPKSRYLFSDMRFGQMAVAIWKAESARLCQGRPKGKAYETYQNWNPQPNEIAVFTLYAYADLQIPMQFDMIFDLDNPNNFHQEPFELTQSIFEAWWPAKAIEAGCKHICVFRFADKPPQILSLLYELNGKVPDDAQRQTRLGFCQSQDFPEIAQEILRVQALKHQYGAKWWEHDDEQPQ